MWLTAQKWAIRLFSFVTIAVLTRLLTPEDFGTVAAASTVLPFFYLLADLGFAAYIVQVDKTNQGMLSTAFWFSLASGIVLCAAVWGLSPLMGLAFDNPQVVPVLQAMSLWVLVTAVGSVPSAIARREMRFAALAGQGAIAAVIAQVIALILAFRGFGVWALVAQTLIAPVVATVLIWFVVRWHPRWSFSGPQFREMTRFGGQVLGVEFVAMLRASGEAAVTSAVLGAAALGRMNVAQRLVQVVQDLTGSAIVPVMNVAFARIRDDVDRLRTAYIRALRMIYLVLSLPLTIVAVGSPLMVPIVFGDGWEQSIPVAQILALAGTLSMAAWLDHGLFYGIGKPGTWFAYAIVTDAVTIATTVLVVRWGLVAIATGFLAVAIVATFARWFLVGRVVQLPLTRIVRPFLSLAMLVGGSGAAGWAVTLLTSRIPALIALLLVAIAITVVHVALSLLVARPALLDILAMAADSRLGTRVAVLARWGR